MKVLIIDDGLTLMLHAAALDGDIVLLNAVDLNGKAPDEIQLIPYGVHNTMKYGKITVDDESLNSIMAFRKTREPNDDVIDYEHATFADPPQKAPAGGWIKRLINKGKEGIWGAVEWTAEARRMIEAKEYRYFSPATITRKSDGKVLGLLGGGLTNLPNIIGMVPLTNKQLIDRQSHKEEPKMKKVFALLGLAETATEDEAVVAINKLIDAGKASETVISVNKAVVEALGLKPEAQASEITGTIMAMKQTHSQHGTLAQQVQDLSARIALRDAEELVMNAMKPDAKGMVKILPAQKEWALGYAKADPKGFEVYVNKTTGIMLTGQIASVDKGGGGEGALDETTLQVCKMMGNKPEDVKKTAAA